MKSDPETGELVSILQDILIFEMARVGVSQSQIRQALGLRMNRINRIAKLAPKAKKQN